MAGDETNATIYFLPCPGEAQLMERDDKQKWQGKDIDSLCCIPITGSTNPEKALRGLLFSYLHEKAHYLYASIPFNIIPLICQRMATGKTVAEAIEEIQQTPQLKGKLTSFKDLEPNSDESLNKIKDEALVVVADGNKSSGNWGAKAQSEKQKLEERIELLHSILIGLETAPPKLKEILEYLSNPENSEAATKSMKLFSTLIGGK